MAGLVIAPQDLSPLIWLSLLPWALFSDGLGQNQIRLSGKIIGFEVSEVNFAERIIRFRCLAPLYMVTTGISGVGCACKFQVFQTTCSTVLCKLVVHVQS